VCIWICTIHKNNRHRRKQDADVVATTTMQAARTSVTFTHRVIPTGCRTSDTSPSSCARCWLIPPPNPLIHGSVLLPSCVTGKILVSSFPQSVYAGEELLPLGPYPSSTPLFYGFVDVFFCCTWLLFDFLICLVLVYLCLMNGLLNWI
jgi:hypothetical protein